MQSKSTWQICVDELIGLIISITGGERWDSHLDYLYIVNARYYRLYMGFHGNMMRIGMHLLSPAGGVQVNQVAHFSLDIANPALLENLERCVGKKAMIQLLGKSILEAVMPYGSTAVEISCNPTIIVYRITGMFKSYHLEINDNKMSI